MRKIPRPTPTPKLTGQALMDAVDNLIRDFHESTRAWRAKNPGDYPPLPGDYPNDKAWLVAHNEWRVRVGLPTTPRKRPKKVKEEQVAGSAEQPQEEGEV